MIAFVLSVVFLAAATAKLLDPWSLRLTLRELLPTLPRMVAHTIAVVVPLVELTVALLFLAGPRPLGAVAAAGTAILAGGFASAYALARRRPAPVLCRCFGLLEQTTLSMTTVILAGLLLVAAVGWTWLPAPFSTFPSLGARLLALVSLVAVVIRRRAASAPSPAARVSKREGVSA